MDIDNPFVLFKFEEFMKEIGKEDLHPKEELYVSYRKLFYSGFMWVLFFDKIKETFFIKMIEDECRQIKTGEWRDTDEDQLLIFTQFLKFVSQPFCPITIEGNEQVRDFVIVYTYGVESAMKSFVEPKIIDDELKQSATFECYLFLGLYCKF